MAVRSLKLELDNSIVRLMQLGPGASDPLHTHREDYQVSVPLDGSPWVEHNGRVLALKEGTRLVTSPSEQHRHFEEAGESRLLLVSLQRTFLQEVAEEGLQRPLGTLEFTALAEGSAAGFQRLAERIIAGTMSGGLAGMSSGRQASSGGSRAKGTGGAGSLSAGIGWQELELDLAHLLLTVHPGSHSGLWRPQVPLALHPALQVALECLHDEQAADLSLDVLAAAAGLSKYHLLRLFREHLGQTPGQYLTDLRVRRAAERLAGSGKEITEIALEAGFGSLSSFHRAFKSKFGVTASEYRKASRGM